MLGTSNGQTVWTELWRATKLNALVEDVSDILTGGSVSMNVDRDPKLDARFMVTDPARLGPYTDYLAPFSNIVYDDGRPSVRQQVGLFTIRVPSGSRSIDWATAEYHARDLTADLARQAFDDTYNIAVGTNYVTAIIAIIESAGFLRHSIVATSQTLASNLSIEAGTTKLAAVNQLLKAVGYYNLYTTGDGRLTSKPSQAVQYVEPLMTLTSDDIEGEIETQPLDTTVANVIIVLKNDPAAVPLKAIRRNDDPASPTSTVNLGEIARSPETVPDLADQAAVDAYADRLLSEGRTFYRTSRIITLPNPDVIMPHQTVRLDLSGKQAVFNGLWWIRTADFGFMAESSKPRLELNQVVDAIQGVLV